MNMDDDIAVVVTAEVDGVDVEEAVATVDVDVPVTAGAGVEAAGRPHVILPKPPSSRVGRAAGGGVMITWVELVEKVEARSVSLWAEALTKNKIKRTGESYSKLTHASCSCAAKYGHAIDPPQHDGS